MNHSLKKFLPFPPLGSRIYLYLFLGFWLILNIFQALYTELFNDEAYYYFYSLHPAWGYYDHPPLIALLIKAGYAVFSNELGVRLLVVILSPLSILILIHLEKVKDNLLFVSLFFSVLIFQITGFLAVPDTVLFFFTIVFFYVYQRFLEKSSLSNTIVLGVTMAFMLYSKYHGILVIFFTILSNIRLLKNVRFWLAGLTGILLYLPHLYWQFSHHFPSLYYHLIERSHDEGFLWTNLSDYLAGQVAMMNPFLFFLLIYFLILFKPASRYDKALQFNAIGILCLPLFLALKGRVESNWSLAAYVPLILISYRMLQYKVRLQKYVYVVGIVSFALVMALRFLLIENYLPDHLEKQIHLETHGWKEWNRHISHIAGSRPVVFMGSYQTPSKYIFYSGKEAFTFNTWKYRTNQYDLENIEQTLQGKEVVVFFERRGIKSDELREFKIGMTDSVMMMNGKYQYIHVSNHFRSYNYLPVKFKPERDKMAPGSVLPVEVTLQNPGSTPVNFMQDSTGRVLLVYSLFKSGKVVQEEKILDISHQVLFNEIKTFFLLKIPEEPGIYYLRIAIKTDWLPLGINSRFYKIKVSDK